MGNKPFSEEKLVVKYGLPTVPGGFHAIGRYEMDRSDLGDAFGDMLEAIGCDHYGRYLYGYDRTYIGGKDGDWYDEANWRVAWPERAGSLIYNLTTEGAINTPVFWLFPYTWKEERQDLYALPNFVYKPKGWAIEWYKYPLRSAHSNVSVSADAWKAAFADVIASVSDAGTFNDGTDKRIGVEVFAQTLRDVLSDIKASEDGD